MSSVYGRLGFDFDTAKFGGDDTLTPGVLNFLGNTTINLSDWQIEDLANNEVYGYFQNPHNDSLGAIAVFLTGISTYANTEMFDYGNARDVANGIANVVSSAQNSLLNFTYHTNNLSGVSRSSNVAAFPDYSSALAIGRQILNITNKSDGVQNNTPILGNFTSLYVGEDISFYANTMANDYITITDSFSSNVSNISNAQMNAIISDITTMQNFIDTRKNADISFYLNSYEIMQEYQTVLQFSSLGATQNNLIVKIGTDKLKADLA